METNSKLPLDRLILELPANIKALLRTGELTVYDVLELLTNTANSMVKNVDGNNAKLEDFAEGLLEWREETENELKKDYNEFIEKIYNAMNGGDSIEFVVKVNDGSIAMNHLNTELKNILNNVSLIKGITTNLDALKTKSDSGVWFYYGQYMRGMAYVSWTKNDNIVQTLLSSETPIYDDSGTTIVRYDAEPCVLFREYANGAWSKWSKVTGDSTDINIDWNEATENLKLYGKSMADGYGVYMSDKGDTNAKYQFTVPMATKTENGLMSKTDKKKLDLMPFIEFDQENNILVLNGLEYKLTPVEEKIVEDTEYSDVTISSFEYSKNSVSADGDTVYPKMLVFKQTKTTHYSDGSTTKSDNICTLENMVEQGANVTFVCTKSGITLNPKTGEASFAPSAMSNNNIYKITAHVEWNGKSSINESAMAYDIIQEKASFTLSRTMVNVAAEGNTVTLTATVKGDVKNIVITSSDQSIANGEYVSESKTLKITVKPSTSSLARTCKIYVDSNVGRVAEVTIMQEAADSVETVLVGTSVGKPETETYIKDNYTKTVKLAEDTNTVEISTTSSDSKNCHWIAIPSGSQFDDVKYIDNTVTGSRAYDAPSVTVGNYKVYYRLEEYYMGATTVFVISK